MGKEGTVAPAVRAWSAEVGAKPCTSRRSGEASFLAFCHDGPASQICGRSTVCRRIAHVTALDAFVILPSGLPTLFGAGEKECESLGVCFLCVVVLSRFARDDDATTPDMAQDASAPQPGTFAAFLAEVAAAGGQAHMQAFAELGVTSRALVGPSGPALAAAGVPEQVILNLAQPASTGPAPSALVPRRADLPYRRPVAKASLQASLQAAAPQNIQQAVDALEANVVAASTMAGPGLQDQVLAQARVDEWRRTLAYDPLEVESLSGVPPRRRLPLGPALHRRGLVAPRTRAAGGELDEHEKGSSAPR